MLWNTAPHNRQKLAIARRNKLVVANWKMYGSLALCRETINQLNHIIQPGADLIISPPAPYLSELGRLAQKTGIHCCGQDVAAQQNGARTGEWSATMLAELGCHHAIVGHSERRQHHREDNVLIAAKAQACIDAGITPIVCIGETLDERNAGQLERVLGQQLDALLATSGWREAIIAYEPVWAIGTGKVATPAIAQAAHQFIREYLAKTDADAAEEMMLLYGGSVKADNATALFAMPDIDGGLIGSASLEVHSLVRIYQAASLTSRAAAQMTL
ncbi:triose-phosphate isomerase [Deefgea sp. CFH1-16]|uniref:triose-phosphate isomerase n=1 Tax=Deefgea sp. CFH1-16 TaxID=2675457 RepID=UPI0015F69044|nr:triose-phosphate isomerase [Deefgea sp. CFH1-16]MBM5573133.1 triose-phosphate isomerase [Deefgea sp. CFH1-16]